MASEMRESYIEIDRCRICGNEDLVSILSLGTQYLTGVFPNKIDRSLTQGPLELVKCNPSNHRDHCGLVQLRQSYNSAELYGDNYGYRSSLNSSMVEHLKALTQELQRIVSIDDRDIVLDIGSNDGTLLSFYPEKGPQLLGMDPTAKKFCKYYNPHIQLITEFFSADRFKSLCGDRKAKIVTSIAMFYDLQDPLGFMRQVYEILADDGVWLFEQSYLLSMLSSNGYDTICHEHLEYYALRQIKFMTDRVGMKIIDLSLNDVNGGSITVAAAKESAPYPEMVHELKRLLQIEEKAGLGSFDVYSEFAGRVLEHREKLVEFLNNLKIKDQLVLGYGASTKGNVILQFCGLSTDHLPCIAEVNEEKVGCYTPGTHIPIVSESTAHQMKPDCFLVLPWHFKNHLLKKEAAFLKNGGKMIFPLPEIEVI
jgi:hypothetical protein